MNAWWSILTLVAAVLGGGGFVALVNRKATNAGGTNTLEQASKSFRDEVRKDSAEVKAELQGVKVALINLTNIIEDLLPGMTSLTPTQRNLLRDAIVEAKLAA